MLFMNTHTHQLEYHDVGPDDVIQSAGAHGGMETVTINPDKRGGIQFTCGLDHELLDGAGGTWRGSSSLRRSGGHSPRAS